MRRKCISVACICGLCVLTACSSNSESNSTADSAVAIETTVEHTTEEYTTKESTIEELTTKESTLEEQTTEEQTTEEQTTEEQTTEESTTEEVTTEAVVRFCSGQAISFEVPEDSWYDDYTSKINKEYYRVFMYPDDEYKELIITGNAWKDSMASFTTREELNAEVEKILASAHDYLVFDCDARKTLEWVYGKEIPNASTAYEYCYKDYIDTEYRSEPSPTKNATGRYTEEIAGSTAYIVWHSGSSDNPLINAIVYECFMDLPSGNIMEFTFTDLSSTVMKNVNYVLDSLKIN